MFSPCLGTYIPPPDIAPFVALLGGESDSDQGMEIKGTPSPGAPPHGSEDEFPGISNLDQLEDTGTILGRGSAGLVKLVRLKATDQLFALKVHFLFWEAGANASPFNWRDNSFH